MKHKPAMYALLDLHSTLGGEILKNKERAAELADAMRHVEAVIKMLDPQFSLRRVAVKRRKANQWFRRGTLYRKAVDVLRTAEKPMAATDIAWAVLKRANIETTDKKAVQALGQGIQSSLRKHKGKSIEVVNDGFPALWRLCLQDA
jgi:hypothetical protein